MDQVAKTAGRNKRGQFEKGASGNPAGKPKGTRNRATIVAEALRAGEGEALLRQAIEAGLAGKWGPNRFLLEWLHPKPRGREIELDLPLGTGTADLLAGWDALLGAMAEGTVTPDEATTIGRLIEARGRVAVQLHREEQSADPAAGFAGERRAREPAEILAGVGLAELDALMNDIAAAKAALLAAVAEPSSGAARPENDTRSHGEHGEPSPSSGHFAREPVPLPEPPPCSPRLRGETAEPGVRHLNPASKFRPPLGSRTMNRGVPEGMELSSSPRHLIQQPVPPPPCFPCLGGQRNEPAIHLNPASKFSLPLLRRRESVASAMAG